MRERGGNLCADSVGDVLSQTLSRSGTSIVLVFIAHEVHVAFLVEFC